MPCVDVVDVFLRMTGCTGRGRMLYLSYVEYAITLLLFAGTCLSITGRREHHPSTATAVDGFSVQLYGVLCLLIESFVLLCLPLRLYHRSDFHDIHRYASTAGIPDDYRSSIGTITVYHLVAANVFATGAAVYAAVFDSVHAGDPFTFPFADVLRVPTTSAAVYVCKYAVYVLPVYIAHVEICFLNATFVYSAGVVKQHLAMIAEQVEAAITDGDRRELKNAIKHHQEILKYFNNMKTVYAKPLLLSISFHAIFLGFITCMVFEAIQGNIQQILLGISIASGMAALISSVIYCAHASKMSGLHEDILYIFSDPRLNNLDKSFKSISLIMMARINVPLDFTVGYICMIKLNLLVKILKFSYSVLNVLLALLTRHNLI